MSAPDPNKWEATDAECQMIGSRLSAAVLAETVARRRALAELKALIGETCNFCLAGLPYVLDVNGKGYGGHPNESGGGHFICTDYRVRNRIAEIEAEEA